MNYKLSYKIIAVLFAALLIGTGIMLTQLKNKPQVYLLLFGLLTLGSLIFTRPIKTSIPFYLLLGIMLYVNLFIVILLLVNVINPNDGLFIDSNGETQYVMAMNWIWGAFIGAILAPFAIYQYHKKVSRNKVLEIGLTSAFVLLTAILYFSNELL